MPRSLPRVPCDWNGVGRRAGIVASRCGRHGAPRGLRGGILILAASCGACVLVVPPPRSATHRTQRTPPLDRLGDSVRRVDPLPRVDHRKERETRKFHREPHRQRIEPRFVRRKDRSAQSAPQEVDHAHAADLRTEAGDHLLGPATRREDGGAIDAGGEGRGRREGVAFRSKQHLHPESARLGGDGVAEIGRNVAWHRRRHRHAAEVGAQTDRADQRIEGSGDVHGVGVVRGRNEEVEAGAREFVSMERGPKVAPRRRREFPRPRLRRRGIELHAAEADARHPRKRIAHRRRTGARTQRRDGRCESRAFVSAWRQHGASVSLRRRYDLSMQRIADIVFWLSVMLWFALAVVGGVAAMAVFPAARELPLSMAGYESFIAAEPVLGRQLVAGFLVERVFDLALPPRVAIAGIAVAGFLAQWLLARRAGAVEPLRKLRAAALACAAAALVASLVAIVEFRVADRRYRGLAAEEGSRAAALEAKVEVDRSHNLASQIATAEVLSLLALAGLSAAARGRTQRA